MPNPKKIIKAVNVDNILKSLPKAPPRTAAEVQRMGKFIDKEIAKLKKHRDSLEKHPLVRNAGQPSAEGKYRANSGKPVPVKKRGK